MAYNVGAAKTTDILYAPKSASRRKKELNANGKPPVHRRSGNVHHHTDHLLHHQMY